MSQPVCFLDMDGVLADFVGGVLEFYKKDVPYREIKWDFFDQLGFKGKEKLFWEPLGYEFWKSLKPTEECFKIVSVVEKFFGDRVAILTSPCQTDGCVQGKIDWIKKHLPKYERRLLVGPCKSLLGAGSKLLIDDHDKNVDDFIQEDGHAILLPRPWNRNAGILDLDGDIRNYLIDALIGLKVFWRKNELLPS